MIDERREQLLKMAANSMETYDSLARVLLIANKAAPSMILRCEGVIKDLLPDNLTPDERTIAVMVSLRLVVELANLELGPL